MNTEEKLAREFSRIVTKWLGEITMRKVIQENESHKGTMYEDCCATGNYCDSNEAMLQAFEIVIGRECYLSFGPNGEETPEHFAKYEADCDLWNSAWNLAKANNYWLGEMK